MINTVSLSSPAKINLFLKVLKKRKDGYHEIRSLFQAIDLRDEISLRRTPCGIKIVTSTSGLPRGKSNLAYRAAELFLTSAKIKSGVEIKIKKAIPLGAGLGGGSSNAASTLLGLDRLFNTGLSHKRLHGLASLLGSDVPFFLQGGSALATGRGEKLKAISLPLNYWLLVVNPGFQISTKWAYSHVKPDTSFKPNLAKLHRLTPSRMTALLKPLGNDLQENVVQRYPVIEKIIAQLQKTGAKYAAMSGSGPTVFGIHGSQKLAKSAARSLKKRRSYKVWLSKPVRN